SEQDSGESESGKRGLSGHAAIVTAVRNPVPERLHPGINATPFVVSHIRNTGFVTAAIPAAGPDADGVRRRELAPFLRRRRERITPDQVGLAPSRRRRTPGLRREEVAQLAGVGVTWYTWLEQGRDINASAQVLEAIARTLLLDAHERAHLF